MKARANALQRWIPFLLVGLILPITGCVGMVAHALYVIKGDKIPAAYEGMEEKRVAVVCSSVSPANGPTSPSGMIARQVSTILQSRVDDIDVVRQEEIADWIDRNDWDEIDYTEIGRGVNADLLLLLDVQSFSIRDGQTLYKGRATVQTTVFDIQDRGKVAYQADTFDFTFPENGAKHTTETNEASFRRAYIGALSRHLAKEFFAYEKSEDFAHDASLIR